MKQKKEKKILKKDIEQYMPYINHMIKNHNLTIAAILAPSKASRRFRVLPLKQYKGGYFNFNSWIDTGQTSWTPKAAISKLFSRSKRGFGSIDLNLQCVVDLENDKVYYNGIHSINIKDLVGDSKLNIRHEKLRNTIINI